MIKIKGKGKMMTYWVGGNDNVAITPAPTAKAQENISNPMTKQHKAEVQHEKPLCNTTKVETRDDSDHDTHVSHLTHDTLLCESLSDSGRDHHVKVHSQQHSRPTKIQMDGSLRQVIGDANPAAEIC
jgi:hypothetical protein